MAFKPARTLGVPACIHRAAPNTGRAVVVHMAKYMLLEQAICLARHSRTDAVCHIARIQSFARNILELSNKTNRPHCSFFYCKSKESS
jgi:hypothetical protein